MSECHLAYITQGTIPRAIFLLLQLFELQLSHFPSGLHWCSGKILVKFINFEQVQLTFQKCITQSQWPTDTGPPEISTPLPITFQNKHTESDLAEQALTRTYIQS